MPGLLFETAGVTPPQFIRLCSDTFVTYNLGDFLFGIWTRGNPVDWYWACMQHAEESDHEVAFIGIDCKSAFPSDIYKLSVLTKMSHEPNGRNGMEQAHFGALVDTFALSVRAYNYEDYELSRIAQVCSLGPDPTESHKQCQGLYSRALTMNPVVFKKYMLNMGHYELCAHNSVPNNNTFIRFMAHMCYLYAQTKPTGTIRSLFGLY